ncbi:MAG: hypothetical protein K2Y29_20440 [Beijerinckiaceae bacterium]|nr:hypothetical protein [Beijerinckiaceae bacterium]
MRPSLKRLDAAPLPLLLALGAALAAAALAGPAAAQGAGLPRGVYVIPAGGYGVDECVAKSAECGRVVANAWCEANGHGKVKAFGSASDITFSAGAAVKAPPRDSIVIACAD